MIGLDDDQVLLPEATLTASPSRLDGITEEEENQHRILGCEMVQEAGILLRLPQVVMATGQNILHRFFYRLDLTNTHNYLQVYVLIVAHCLKNGIENHFRGLMFLLLQWAVFYFHVKLRSSRKPCAR